jgi:hypothetical protein
MWIRYSAANGAQHTARFSRHWHEMAKGPLIFTAPRGAFADDQLHSIQGNLNWSQGKFLKPKPKKAK